ncbi:MAG: CRISPR-associated endonuclease Cas1 [Coriobacteriia bacterium]|nr:CRISPR-associated endonuclease Cas1 [Coriobacteriia bacterium]
MLDSIVVMGNSQITEQAIRFATANSVDIIHTDQNGHIIAVTNSFSNKKARLRLLQYKAYNETMQRLGIAKLICKRKLEAQESYLKNRRSIQFTERHVFRDYIEQLDDAKTVNELLGIEGAAANFYFNKLNSFSLFSRRTRRPATDIINALMNLTYSLVQQRVSSTLVGKGFDLQIGYLHSISGQRPSLALDFLELFRSQADAFVVTATNRKEFTIKDFDMIESNKGLYLSREAFARFLKKFNESLVPELEIDKEANWLRGLLLESFVGFEEAEL